nr:hypothetical protein [Vibrio cholerae]
MSRRTSRQRHWYQLLREKSHQKEILIHDKNPLPSSENNLRWSSKIHQLNSDILQRHILPRINSNHYPIYFDFCEIEQSGKILSDSGIELGHFNIH